MRSSHTDSKKIIVLHVLRFRFHKTSAENVNLRYYAASFLLLRSCSWCGSRRRIWLRRIVFRVRFSFDASKVDLIPTLPSKGMDFADSPHPVDNKLEFVVANRYRCYDRPESTDAFGIHLYREKVVPISAQLYVTSSSLRPDELRLHENYVLGVVIPQRGHWIQFPGVNSCSTSSLSLRNDIRHPLVFLLHSFAKIGWRGQIIHSRRWRNVTFSNITDLGHRLFILCHSL
mmetsp:Transcript_34317/g.134603  ORF Transcript_34317/g.134603 Transcript_34317/m.134603 type:complete len:230 (-) Transcript_34317:644-1333(-)